MCADLTLMMEPGPCWPLHSGRSGRTVAEEWAGQDDLSMTEVLGLRARQPPGDLAASPPDLGLCEPSSLSHLSGMLTCYPTEPRCGSCKRHGNTSPAWCRARG